ncbi:MAG: type II secretion system protein, partial [Phycisphaerales bacterium]|nr:type II secretion system protein [Phycisphaerales bacterium]
GILAAIVVPQFTNASNEAVKGAIQSQLQTISSQMELYRVRNQGAYPTLGDGEENNGWGELVGESYLKEEPFNGYTGTSAIVVGGEAAALAGTRDSASGWNYDATTYEVFATGYDATNNALAHEDTFEGAEEEE